MENATPMLRQYQEIKSKNKDFILFFRLGDFYEMFFDDAKAASNVLDLVLTSRPAGKLGKIPMCGIPYHSAENYISRLIRAGYKVAICEQVQDPKTAKGIVERRIVRKITPGTYISEEESLPSFVAGIVKDKTHWGLALVDIQTGSFQANVFTFEELIEQLLRYNISEIVIPDNADYSQLFNSPDLAIKAISISRYDDWKFSYMEALQALKAHFKVKTLSGFGIPEKGPAIPACGALISYIKDMLIEFAAHITSIKPIEKNRCLQISASAMTGLGLDMLFKVIDFTGSAIGRRVLNLWLSQPLIQVDAIIDRQNAISRLREAGMTDKLRKAFSSMPDAEKSLSRISCRQGRPRDLLSILQAIEAAEEVKTILDSISNSDLDLLNIDLTPVLPIRDMLNSALNRDIPAQNYEGKVIKKGFNAQLDELMLIREDAKALLKNMQEEEIKRTGINSLKIGYNKVFGYYIEVSRANLKLVPENYIRKQTLVNAERFITPELKSFEEKILSANEKAIVLEQSLIDDLFLQVVGNVDELKYLFAVAGGIDALNSLAVFSERGVFCRPEIDDSFVIDIKEGRHPVVEQALAGGEFIANDLYLDGENTSMGIITGPNMSGKSTYIRQCAILIILAQIGAFIPAKQARIGIVDKIFTRIGAQDDIAKGQSTFMVEMSETAFILNNATEKSFVILDEIGRGTSTYDGLSIAWAVAEFLAKKRVRSLFATHFHELTALEEEQGNIANFNVSVKEWMDEVVFLHKIVSGAADQSYGIYVAKIAGIPKKVIDRARQVLSLLEGQNTAIESVKYSNQEEFQMNLFAEPVPKYFADLDKMLKQIDPNDMTPRQALDFLYKIKDLGNGKD